ncbi:hypothetical protein ACFO4O_15655 [Glaciecola siphonariae]|uniref:Holin n=1 Tax=Glaciecola siphonariae TaxID=521012 RepID=A0ABV9LYE4_9ALTE
MDYYVYVGALFLIAVNIAVSVFCLKRDDLNQFQKLSQTSIVWLIPILGAILVYAVNSNSDNTCQSLDGSLSPTGEHSSAATGNSSSFSGDGGGSD